MVRGSIFRSKEGDSGVHQRGAAMRSPLGKNQKDLLTINFIYFKIYADRLTKQYIYLK
jgi:hypothetical protein